MNKSPLLSKVLAMGALMCLLLVPLLMVKDLIAERTANRRDATDEVARAHAREQTLIGPVLWLPYTETFVRRAPVDGQPGQVREELVTESRVSIQFPQTQATRSALETETRQRGIFPVTVYTSRHATTGRIVVEEVKPRQPGGRIVTGQPLLLLGVSDARGLLGAPRLRLGGATLTVEQAPTGTPLPLAAATPLDSMPLEMRRPA